MDSPQAATHRPVLPEETLCLLEVRRGAVVLDGTVGLGGHARLLAEAIGPEGLLIGLDRDPAALVQAGRVLADAPCRVELLHLGYEQAEEALRRTGAMLANAVLLDLGVSSMQLDDPARGFSFRHAGPLDMRMDPGSGPDAAALVEQASEAELVRILRDYGEERHAGRVAAAIVRARREAPIRDTERLAQVVAGVLGRPPGQRIHPATRSFQALRIAVNRELERLEQGLVAIPARLAPGGRMAVISFHSLEDRLVKQAFRKGERSGKLRSVTKKAVVPSEDEMAGNPRARSARLRVAERL